MAIVKRKPALKSAAALLSATALLAACSTEEAGLMRNGPEAGVLLNGADFGNATMHNSLVMSGERSYTIDLANRFATETVTQVYFAFNSSTLDAGARDALRQQAHWIRQFPEVRFRVFGHADAPGSNTYNKRLGLRRAQAVVGFLISQGISRSRLEAVSSLGETQPIVRTDGRERRNRRAVTEVSGFVQRHPTVMDGKYAAVIYREYIKSAQPKTTLSTISGSEFKTGQ